mgnify:CR=1 FL=1
MLEGRSVLYVVSRSVDLIGLIPVEPVKRIERGSLSAVLGPE